jgi:hypothetical protein
MTFTIGAGGVSRADVAKQLRPGGVYRSGTRVSLPLGTGNAVANPVTADLMYAWPIPVEAAFRASAVEIAVGTATPATNAKLGLALPGPDGFPFALLAECAAPVDCSLAADTILQAVITDGVDVPMGWVWGLSVYNGSAQLVRAGAFSNPALPIGHFVGQASMQGYTGRGTVGGSCVVTRAHTYANAFPAQLTGWSTGNTIPSSPYTCVVVA